VQSYVSSSSVGNEIIIAAKDHGMRDTAIYGVTI